MKKYVARLLVLAMLLTLAVLPLSSCSEVEKFARLEGDERAVTFYQMMETKTNEATSAQAVQKMSMKLDIGEMAYEQITDGSSTYIKNGDELTYLEQTTSTVWVGGEKIVTYEDEGYMNGMMFTYIKEDGVETKLKSPITAAEYEAFRDKQAEDVPDTYVGEGYCTDMTCEQAEDGTWTAVYQGFTEEGMKPFTYYLRSIETAVNAEHTLKDVRMTVTADAELTPVSMIMEYVFEEKENAETRVPNIKLETYFYGLNNTVLVDTYDISDFKELEDLRIIEDFLSAMQDREEAESGAFSVTTKSSGSYSGESVTETSVQNVTFKNHDGYEFTLDFEEEGYLFSTSYKKGSMTVTVREEKTGEKVHSESTDLTDFEAQATVQQLMNPVTVSTLDIVGATVTDAEKGIYTFNLGDSVKNEFSEEYEETYGAPVKNFKGHIEATMVDGELTEYTYHVYTTLSMEGITLTVTVDVTIVFSDLVEGGETV